MKRLTCLMSVLTLTLALSACGGGGGGGGGGEGSSPAADQASPAPTPEPPAPQETTPVSPAYAVTLLGSFAGDSYAVALNDAGQVAGNYTGPDGVLNAFRWEDGGVSQVVTDGQAKGINNQGEVVGWMEPMGYPEAFLYLGEGQVIRLNTVGGSSRALAINDSSQTAGRISSGGESAFLEENGNLQFIAREVEGYAIAMNNVGQVLIKRLDADGCRTLLWEQGALTDLGSLGGSSTQGVDINDAGQVVGWAQTAGGQYHAFLWENGTMVDLSPLAGEFSSAVAINDRGQILLKSSDISGSRNFLYADGVVTDLGNFGTGYAVVNDLNNRGEIVGWMVAGDGISRAFLARPNSDNTPE